MTPYRKPSGTPLVGVIGKDFYCVKNNLTIMIEDEEEEDSYLARLNTMGFTVERLEKFASREEELALSKHFKKEDKEAATAAEVDDDEDDEPLEPLADPVKAMSEDDWRQLESQIEDYVSANGLLFGILNDDLSQEELDDWKIEHKSSTGKQR